MKIAKLQLDKDLGIQLGKHFSSFNLVRHPSLTMAVGGGLRQGVVWVLNLSAGGKTPQEGSSLAKSLWRASRQKVEEKLVLAKVGI